MGKVKNILFHFEYPIDTKLIFLPTGDTTLTQSKVSDI